MKYKVKLSDNYNHPAFTCSWSTTLLGDKLRVEFDKYLEEYKKENEIVEGGTEKILVSDVLQTFMTQEQQINLIKDEGGNGLKSVFLLRPGESLEIDEHGYEALKRYERKKKVASDGTSTSDLGFMEFELVDKGEPEKDIQVSGKRFGDIEETKEEVKEAKEEIPEVFECENCGKEFETKRALSGHNISCKK